MFSITVFILCFVSISTASATKGHHSFFSDYPSQSFGDDGDIRGAIWREKRQTRLKCPSDQWQCDDGTCINAIAVRDGTNDCPDGSDEVSYVCDSATQFQCKDSSCISLDQKCNSVRDCTDGSDEISADCGTSLQVHFFKNPDPRYPEPIQKIVHALGICEMPPYPAHGRYIVHSRPTAKPGEVFKTAILIVSCDPGYEVAGPTDTICYDGIWSAMLPDCVLTTEICVLPPYPAHGSYMVSNNPDAAPRQAFASVELDITCDSGYDIGGQTDLRIVCHNGRWSGEITDCVLTSGACKLPPYPAHGSYVVSGAPDAAPGKTFVRVALNITCDPGYSIHGDTERRCYNGAWSANMTDCVASCHLEKDETVIYQCLNPNRECGLEEDEQIVYLMPDGTVAIPVCKQNYFFPVEFNEMRCFEGNWNYIARCVPASTGECVLPPFPGNGSYVVSGVPNFEQGQAFNSIALTITCNPGFDIAGSKERSCYDGIWSGDVTDCVPKTELCTLPLPPTYGWYSVPSSPGASPGEVFDTISLNYVCDFGYEIIQNKNVTCVKGKWSGTVKQCERVTPFLKTPIGEPAFDPKSVGMDTGLTGYCRLKKDPSVNYLCLLSAASTATRECNELEPVGTIVRPECKVPNYYFPGTLNHMRCYDDKWNYIARCVPECGLVTPRGTELVIGGREAERGELPWHAAVYHKKKMGHVQICGGSLVSPKVVISAGHCFEANHRLQPASRFAVALGKLHRAWYHDQDDAVQKSELSDLKFPARFAGALTNYQEDIALLFLQEAVTYQRHIRPVCLDFNPDFEKEQLRDGNLGKVAGWGLTSANGSVSDTLKVVELPFVPIERCQADAPLDFREYITGDKICAGDKNGTALCRGDSGGGLAFPKTHGDKTRYYLRGVVSTAPVVESVKCYAYWRTMFTHVSSHERFIKENLD